MQPQTPGPRPLRSARFLGAHVTEPDVGCHVVEHLFQALGLDSDCEGVAGDPLSSHVLKHDDASWVSALVRCLHYERDAEHLLPFLACFCDPYFPQGRVGERKRQETIYDQHDVWDTPLWFVLMVAALTAEWIIRRRAGLV